MIIIVVVNLTLSARSTTWWAWYGPWQWKASNGARHSFSLVRFYWQCIWVNVCTDVAIWHLAGMVVFFIFIVGAFVIIIGDVLMFCIVVYLGWDNVPHGITCGVCPTIVFSSSCSCSSNLCAKRIRLSVTLHRIRTGTGERIGAPMFMWCKLTLAIRNRQVDSRITTKRTVTFFAI